VSPPDALQRIAVAVTPAVMVSACGLIALGLDNQVSRMSARLRELANRYRALDPADRGRPLVRRQIELFDLRHRILTRALLLVYAALFLFVLTSVLSLAQGAVPVPAELPLAVFTCGVVCLGGMAVYAIRSLQSARSALRIEQREVFGGEPAPAGGVR
jgi:hypothetical protein